MIRTMRVLAIVVALAGCGRIGFDPAADSSIITPTADARATVSPPSIVSDTTANADCPSLVWSGSRWGVAWLDIRDGAPGEVYFALADATGAKLMPDLRVTNDPAMTQCPSLAWNGTAYLVVFSDARGTYKQIFGQFISATGTLVGAPIQITTGNNNETSPKLAYAGSEYDLVYSDQHGGFWDLVHTRLTAAGAATGATTILQNNGEYSSESLLETATGLAVGVAVYMAGWSLQLELLANSSVQYNVPVTNAITASPVALAAAGSTVVGAWEESAGAETVLTVGHLDPATGAITTPQQIAYVSTADLTMASSGAGFAVAPVKATAGNTSPSYLLLVGLDGSPADAPVSFKGSQPSLGFDGTQYGCASLTFGTTVKAVQLALITPM
jgi:predicted small lipoprotein YifL